jgi:hypothetical protein
MGQSHRHGRRVAVAVALAISLAMLSMTAAVGADGATPKGTGAPVAATGLSTSAALKNPQCNTTQPTVGPYGQFNSSTLGGGPVCVKPWKAGADNGGATHAGVTADKVTVVAVVPNQAQLAAQIAARTTVPQNRATGKVGTYADSINDQLQPMMEFYETWGRDIEVKVFESTGADEAAQRADVVSIKALEPFAVMDTMTTGLDVLDAELASAKIPVWGFSASSSEATAQAPYRWGASDPQAAVVNAAEVLGKQLVGKKAEFGGDDVKATTRVFGSVYLDGTIDIKQFNEEFATYKGKVASEYSYVGNGSARGDPTLAAQYAPTIAQRLKADGVTTVVLFSDSAMNAALMNEANTQAWFPEWFFTGSFFQDLAVLTRGNPATQMTHAFGLSNFTPFLSPALTPTISTADWFWGPSQGTSAGSAAFLGWLMLGVHTAGPNLTPKTFRQGLFSAPATGGAATGSTTTMMNGYGKTAGLPYDEYLTTGADFVPIWWDSETVGPSQAVGLEGKGVAWFVGAAKRYLAGSYPKKQFTWFDTAGALVSFTSYPGTPPVAAPACTTCPAATGAPAGAADQSTIIAPWHGTHADAS